MYIKMLSLDTRTMKTNDIVRRFCTERVHRDNQASSSDDRTCRYRRPHNHVYDRRR